MLLQIQQQQQQPNNMNNDEIIKQQQQLLLSLQNQINQTLNTNNEHTNNIRHTKEQYSNDDNCTEMNVAASTQAPNPKNLDNNGTQNDNKNIPASNSKFILLPSIANKKSNDSIDICYTSDEDNIFSKI